MSSDELFGSYTASRLNLKSILIGIAALVVLSTAAIAVYWYTLPVPPSADDLLAEQIRDNTVLMLQYRTFSGDEFRQQILGRGRLEKYIQVNDEAFFTFPPADDQEFDEFVAKNFVDTKKIEFGRDEDGILKVGDYKMPASSFAGHFFRTNLANIKIAPKQTLTFAYGDVNYTLTMEELNDFVNDSRLYGGKMVTREPERSNRPMMIFANHGIMVAKPGEPSLTRLANDLLKDVPQTREARIQRLVDFVSNHIEYNFNEAVGSYETLKRPSETLMTRNGDCSNKTILLASLLEQIGEEYIMLYCPHHITVAVPQGAYTSENQLEFTWNGKPWLVAETTLPGFQIGTTRVGAAEILQNVRYVQDPKHVDVIFDANSYEVLKFL